jgi:hypothetical protein
VENRTEKQMPVGYTLARPSARLATTEQAQGGSSMSTTCIAPRSLRRYPLAALGKAVVAALAGVVLLLIYVQARIFGTFDLPLTVFAIFSTCR